MPLYAFKFLKKEIKDLKDKKILLLGVSYRSDVGDTRYSPVEPFYKYLIKDGAKIILHDPFVKFWEELRVDVFQNINKVLKNDLNIVVITTAHSCYKDSRDILELILKQNNLFILDTVGLFNNEEINKIKSKHRIRIIGRRYKLKKEIEKVLLLGGAGFIGFSIAKYLKNEDYKITIADNFSELVE